MRALVDGRGEGAAVLPADLNDIQIEGGVYHRLAPRGHGQRPSARGLCAMSMWQGLGRGQKIIERASGGRSQKRRYRQNRTKEEATMGVPGPDTVGPCPRRSVPGVAQRCLGVHGERQLTCARELQSLTVKEAARS